MASPWEAATAPKLLRNPARIRTLWPDRHGLDFVDMQAPPRIRGSTDGTPRAYPRDMNMKTAQRIPTLQLRDIDAVAVGAPVAPVVPRPRTSLGELVRLGDALRAAIEIAEVAIDAAEASGASAQVVARMRAALRDLKK